MIYLIESLCICLALFVSWKLLNSALTILRRSKSEAASHCKPVLKRKSWDPLFGLDTFIQLRRADRRGQLSQTYRELHDIHGPTFEMKVLGRSQIQTADPANIRAVCTASFDDWGVGPIRGSIGSPFIDRGVFTDDGAYWKHARSLIRPTFNRIEVADLGNFERHVRRFFKLLPSDGSTFDLLPLVKRLFLDTSTEFIFGKSVESLLPETPFETDEFMKAFDRSLLGLALLIIFRPIRWPLYFDPWWRAAYTKVHDFVDKQVAIVLKRREKTPGMPSVKGESLEPSQSGVGGEKTMRERYILLEGMAEVTQDPYDLRMQVINAFFPARDTTAIGFSHIIFLLARHPAVWRDLRQEVFALDATDTSQLTYEVVRSLKLVRAIVNETLRLHPAAARLARVALRDTVLPSGGGSSGNNPVFVPAGMRLEMDLYSLQRDPAIWGPDADKFRPSRWMAGPDGRQRPLWEAKWQYEPFLGGVRMCPAQNMVVTQLCYLLVRFAQEFACLENRDPVLEYVEEQTMTAASRNGTKIALSRIGL